MKLNESDSDTVSISHATANTFTTLWAKDKDTLKNSLRRDVRTILGLHSKQA